MSYLRNRRALGLLVFFAVGTCMANTPFGMVELRSERLNAFPQWQRVIEEHRHFVERFERCGGASRDQCDQIWFAKWRQIEQRFDSTQRLATLRGVNAFFNEWIYINDQENWGRSDWWTAPRIFLERSGDCEDYAISKYYALKKLGFDTNDLRVLVVRDTYRDVAHAVLMVRLNGEYRILDSLSPTVLKPADVHQYRPVYSLNEHYRWLHYQPLPVGGEAGL